MKYRIPFDEHIKEKLSDFEAAVPNDMWDRISKESNKKRPFFVWSFLNSTGFLTLMTIALGVGFYFYKNPQHSSLHPIEKISSSKTNIIAEDNLKNKHITTEPVLKSKYRNPTASTKTKVNAISPGIDQVDETSRINFPSSKHLLVTETVKRKFEKTKSIQPSSTFSNWKEKNIDLSAVNNFDADVNNFSNPFVEPVLHPFLLSIELINVFSKNTPTLKTILKPNYNIPCPTFNTNSNLFYLDFYSATDFINRKFSDTVNSIYLQKRKEGTTITSAFSAGIRFTKLYKSGIAIRGGINFSQINEKFKFTQGNIIQTVYETNASGDTIGSYQTISTRYKITHNQYRNIDFPFTLGYEKSFNKWTLNINGGLIFNLFSTYKGDILDKNFQPIDINESTLEKRYKLKGNIGIGCTGGLSMYYNITERLKLLAEPYFRYNFSSMNQESTEFNQQYNTLGMRAGIRVDLR